ncbi:non-canonical purine NTP pyrophosphatase [Odoribacter laneus]|jgi:non-canonical purine NTP pyrophosphatase, rdgB/HAM1 family|uniref:dITP/XTP pyrophosphatase n=1 Tax=Odoribacter laneus YIT 12061 TaxID=742817 RepID=H1DKJ5_9BACT|nr:non-canonical purine NTP diphosphatase [Odoribacter laneus]EHP45488.1 rdgB/HAM1 family non-canonical purine NTP pyrophosphatase [Odoribacter laneus YIT 12061]MBS1446344.1 non-canonical purine NTP diphosphatase [Odoribacter sp.]GKI23298.1 non-canonical purine NTP pyrophosphatase [Odoribacter laneus]GKI25398.1 non-canonical purine NTP pyrophosphatase [Odoribacter laneus]
MKLVFATNNRHKLEEITRMLKDKYEIISLEEIGCREEIPEDYETLQENALEKARYVKEHYGYDCFADDTGLEIEALGNRPGVYSARYAGPAKNSEDNMHKVLGEMKGEENRKARFRTVIALLLGGEEHFFEGIVEGKILEQQQGEIGFGYDPIFCPEGYRQSFAEMPMEQKNQISHRGQAVRKLAEFLSRR